MFCLFLLPFSNVSIVMLILMVFISSSYIEECPYLHLSFPSSCTLVCNFDFLMPCTLRGLGHYSVIYTIDHKLYLSLYSLSHLIWYTHARLLVLPSRVYTKRTHCIQDVHIVYYTPPSVKTSSCMTFFIEREHIV